MNIGGSALVDGVLGSVSDDRLRLTSWTVDTFDDSQDASIDFHSNNSPGRSGRLDLVVM